MHSVKMAGALALGLLACAALADSKDEHHNGEHREYSAHEHGTAQLNVALDGSALLIELITPAVNIVGFEHAPETDEQKQAVTAAEESLRDGAQVFGLPAAAGCELAEADIESELLAEHDEHDEDKHGHDEVHSENIHSENIHSENIHSENIHSENIHSENIHSEFHASYRFECQTPDQLSAVDVKLFELFPGTESIDAQVIGARGQSAQTLSAGSAQVNL